VDSGTGGIIHWSVIVSMTAESQKSYAVPKNTIARKTDRVFSCLFSEQLCTLVDSSFKQLFRRNPSVPAVLALVVIASRENSIA
jgi:hypothetical protein